MKALRAVLAAALLTASVTTAWRVLVPRVRCSLQKARVNQLVRSDRNTRDRFVTERRARESVEICRRCLALTPYDYEYEMLLGSVQQILGDYDDAEQSFRRSLALNERPETYAYLGMLQLERGQVEEAKQSLYHAALFHVRFLMYVDYPLREELYESVMARHTKLAGKRPGL